MRCFAPLVDEGYVDLLWLPMSHIFGFGEACIGNSLGWTTYLADPSNALKKLPEVRPDVFMSVPRLLGEARTGCARGACQGAPQAAPRRVTGGRLRFCLSAAQG
jgi:long-chain acyl-CoA synthetase